LIAGVGRDRDRGRRKKKTQKLCAGLTLDECTVRKRNALWGGVVKKKLKKKRLAGGRGGGTKLPNRVVSAGGGEKGNKCWDFPPKNKHRARRAA